MDPEYAHKASLNATVYAHVPMEGPPEGVMHFIQFIRPDNGLTMLPLFSDKGQAEEAANKAALIVAMSGRDLFELTRGASLMLNPNVDAIALYPPGVTALLEGRPLGSFTMYGRDAGGDRIPDRATICVHGCAKHDPTQPV
jgi:hypothetical protein